MPQTLIGLFGLWALLAGPVLAAPALSIEDPWIAEAPPVARVHAGYMKLTNPTEQPIRITAVSSPRYGRVEMHRTVEKDGVARMLRMEEIRVEAGGQVVLEPGGMHLMLFDPSAPARLGEQLPLRLELNDGSRLEVTAEVRRRPMPSQQHAPHGHMQH